MVSVDAGRTKNRCNGQWQHKIYAALVAMLLTTHVTLSTKTLQYRTVMANVCRLLLHQSI